MSNCTFEANASALSGGAIYAADAVVTLTDCRFVNNWATGLGGAICAVGSDVVLMGCTFTQNAAEQGGAIYHQQGMLTLTDCEFEANMASKQGGAVDLTEQQNASMIGCAFRNNSMAQRGGAIMNEGVPLLLGTCTFSGNQASYGGAIYAYPSSSGADSQAGGTTMAHCLFAGNYASSRGGALSIYYVEFTISSCTFADNVGGTLTWWGSTTVSPFTMTDCIVWDGNDSLVRSSTSTRGSGTAPVVVKEPTIAYSDVQGGWAGEGNIDSDPCFAGQGYWANPSVLGTVVSADSAGAVWVEGDYHLKSQAGRWDPASETWVIDEITSPCLDAGDPNSPVADEPEPHGDRINMGAYGGTTEASKSL